MSYHSEKLVRNFVLAVNRPGLFKFDIITPQQVEEGALFSSTNEERKHYFTYATMVMNWLVPILSIPSGLLILAYMATLGINLGLVFCTPFWIALFIANGLERKMRQCEKAKELVVFSSKDLLICLLKAAMLAFSVIGTIVWILTSQPGGSLI